MKKKIIVALIVFSLLLVVEVAYLIYRESTPLDAKGPDAAGITESSGTEATGEAVGVETAEAVVETTSLFPEIDFPDYTAPSSADEEAAPSVNMDFELPEATE